MKNGFKKEHRNSIEKKNIELILIPIILIICIIIGLFVKIICNGIFELNNNDKNKRDTKISYELVIDLKYGQNSTPIYINENVYFIVEQGDEGSFYAYGLIDSLGNEIIPIEYENIKLSKNGKYLILRKDIKYYSYDFETKKISKEISEILTDTSIDNIFIGCNYSTPSLQTNNYAIDSCFFTDLQGNKILNKKYDYITSDLAINDGSGFEDELFVVKNQNKWGIIDIKGNAILALEYEHLTRIDKNRITAKKDNKWGIINLKGEIIIPFMYENISSSKTSNNLYAVGKDGKIGVINSDNNVVIPFDKEYFSWYSSLFEFTDYNIIVQNGWNEHGVKIYDLKGKFLFEFDDEIDLFIYTKSGNFIIEKNNVVKFYNQNFKVLKEYPNSTIKDYKHKGNNANNYTETAIALENESGKIGIADESGNILTPFIYDGDSNKDLFIYPDDTVKASLNYKYGIFNLHGDILISPDLEEIRNFKDDLYEVKKQDSPWGVKNLNDQYVIPPELEYDWISIMDQNYIKVVKDWKTGFIKINYE